MKFTVEAAKASMTGRLGPLCIACGNTRRFWIHGTGGDRLCEMAELPDGEVKVLACGKCNSRHSIVVAHVD